MLRFSVDFSWLIQIVEYDRKEYFEIPWASLRSIVEPAFAKRSLINHYEYLPKANIIVSSAVDIQSSQVLTAQARLIGYDYLVIATGHTENGPSTKQDKLCYYQAGDNSDCITCSWTVFAWEEHSCLGFHCIEELNIWSCTYYLLEIIATDE